MHRELAGPARFGSRTKRLVQELRPGEIALIAHRDLDQAAADGLLAAGVRAVVNLEPFLSGRFPARGAQRLLERGVPLFQAVEGAPVLAAWPPGARLAIDPRSGLVRRGARPVARVRPVTPREVAEALARAEDAFPATLAAFVANSLRHALRERDLMGRPLEVPPLDVPVRGRPALVVARGPGHREDLRAVWPFLRPRRPVTVGVDGGADALLELGIRPDLIVGDMDSISDRALTCGARLLVHAYPDGTAPGLARVAALGVPALPLRAPGTSEDAALLLMHACGADPIVLVGAHAGALDFLEKGRPGMGSTLLVRMLVAPRLVDARGLARLQGAEPPARYVGSLLAAAAASAAAVVAVSPLAQDVLRVVWLQVRLALGL